MADGDRVEGEAAIVAALAPLAAGFPGALGLQDDCAVLVPPHGHDLVLKTDAVAEGVHFLPGEDAADIGWKALAVNVSDLAAKGAEPIAYLMSLSFPQAPLAAWLSRFCSGLAEAQAAFGLHLAGGDTDRRAGPLTVTIAAIGAVPAGRMVRRATARAGDRLFVSGTLGDAALGLELARDPALAVRWRLAAEDVRHLRARFHRPLPRLGLRTALLTHARAAMDLSDGLAKDLGRMCRASAVSATVATGSLPLSAAARQAITADPALIQAVVAGGDDYEVLAAVVPGQEEAYRAAAAAGGVAVTEIGQIGAGGGVTVLRPDGSTLPLASTGWDHF